MKRSRLFFSALSLLSDYTMVTLSLILGFLIRAELDVRPLATPTEFFPYIIFSLTLASLTLIIFFFVGMYQIRIPEEKINEAKKIFMAVSSSAMVAVAIDYIRTVSLFPSKSILIYAWLISLVLVFLGRQLLIEIQKKLFKYGIGIQNVLIIGANKSSKILIDNFRKNPQLGYKVKGILNGKEENFHGIKILGSIDDLKKIISKSSIDEIIQADPSLNHQDFIELIRTSDKHKIVFKIAPDLSGVYTTNNRISLMAGIPLVEIIRTPLEGWGRIIKRAFDVAGSLLGIIIFSIPMLIIAMIIKLTDKSYVFYKHERLARAGKTFKLYKFRTMKQEYCTGSEYGGKKAEEHFQKIMQDPEKKKEFENDFKLEKDPRVTKIGKFLRKTSLDEIPQFFNVLRGEMSLVGPRPIVKDEYEKYGKSKEQRMVVKPGMTGLWQVSGRNAISYEERMKLDIYYIEKWSLILDIKILLKTLLVFFKINEAH